LHPERSSPRGRSMKKSRCLSVMRPLLGSGNALSLKQESCILDDSAPECNPVAQGNRMHVFEPQ
jgi:hypothetical protein